MNPRISLHPASTPDFTVEQDIELCRRIGLSRMSLTIKKLRRDGGIEAGIATVAASGLAIDFVIPDPPGFNLRDRTTWTSTRQAFVDAAESAARLNARAVFTVGGGSAGLSFDAAADAFREAIGPVLRQIHSTGLQVYIEPTRPQFAHIAFLHSMRDAAPLAEELGLQLVFDFAHCWWEPGLTAWLTRFRPLLGAVQVCDLDFTEPVLNRANLGDGQLPIMALLRAAAGPGYAGSLDLELTGSRIAAEGSAAALARAARFLDAILEGPATA